jgi:methylmalonyl-CoA mutase N-terminal domain/subunit
MFIVAKQAEQVIVGVNRYNEAKGVEFKNFFRVNPESEKRQMERLSQVKQKRDNQKVRDRLEKVRRASASRDRT